MIYFFNMEDNNVIDPIEIDPIQKVIRENVEAITPYDDRDMSE